MQLVLGKHSGRRAVQYCMDKVGHSLTESQVILTLDHLKRGAAKSMYRTDQDFRELYDEVFPAGDLPASGQSAA